MDGCGTDDFVEQRTGFCSGGREENAKEDPSEKHIEASRAKDKSHVTKKQNTASEGGDLGGGVGTSVPEVLILPLYPYYFFSLTLVW